jgi:hypothetical protein
MVNWVLRGESARTVSTQSRHRFGTTGRHLCGEPRGARTALSRAYRGCVATVSMHNSRIAYFLPEATPPFRDSQSGKPTACILQIGAALFGTATRKERLRCTEIATKSSDELLFCSRFLRRRAATTVETRCHQRPLHRRQPRTDQRQPKCTSHNGHYLPPRANPSAGARGNVLGQFNPAQIAGMQSYLTGFGHVHFGQHLAERDGTDRAAIRRTRSPRCHELCGPLGS